MKSINKVYVIGGISAAGKSKTAGLWVEEFKKINIEVVKVDCDSMYYEKEKLGKALSEAAKSSKVILESASFFLDAQEGKFIKEFFKKHQFRYFLINPNYERWLRNRSHKIDNGRHRTDFMDEADYKSSQEIFFSQMPPNSMVLKDGNNVRWSVVEPLKYQIPEVVEAKWKVFNFPKDMTGKTFLELGCNCGGYLEKAKQQGADVTGLDIEAQSLDVVLDKIPDARIILGRAEDMATTQRFDYILSASSLEWFEEREKVIKKVSEMTDYFVLEIPILEQEADETIYKDTGTGIFYALISQGLLMKWLLKYFQTVEQIGTTIKNGEKRPVFLAREARK